jgi:hypothetical protein
MTFVDDTSTTAGKPQGSRYAEVHVGAARLHERQDVAPVERRFCERAFHYKSCLRDGEHVSPSSVTSLAYKRQRMDGNRSHNSINPEAAK